MPASAACPGIRKDGAAPASMAGLRVALGATLRRCRACADGDAKQLEQCLRQQGEIRERSGSRMIQRRMRLMLAAAVALTAMGAARAVVAADDDLIADAQRTVAAYQKTDPDLVPMFRHAAAYAVFPG